MSRTSQKPSETIKTTSQKSPIIHVNTQNQRKTVKIKENQSKIIKTKLKTLKNHQNH